MNSTDSPFTLSYQPKMLDIFGHIIQRQLFKLIQCQPVHGLADHTDIRPEPDAGRRSGQHNSLDITHERIRTLPARGCFDIEITLTRIDTRRAVGLSQQFRISAALARARGIHGADLRSIHFKLNIAGAAAMAGSAVTSG